MQKKRVATFVTALSLLIGVFSFATPQASITAEASDTWTYQVLSNASQIENELDFGTPSYTVEYTSYDFDMDNDAYEKVLDIRTLDLDEDSFVYIGLKRHSAESYDFDSALTVSQVGRELDTSSIDNHASGFLRKGRHRIEMTVDCFESDYITGSTDVYVLVIPMSKAIKVSKKVAKNKRSATVTVKSNLGSYVDSLSIKRGIISGKISDVAWDTDTMQTVSYDKARAKVTKNGKYTIVVDLKDYDDYETQYGKRTITVSGIKRRR